MINWIGKLDVLLLGRKTYEIYAGEEQWPPSDSFWRVSALLVY